MITSYSSDPVDLKAEVGPPEGLEPQPGEVIKREQQIETSDSRLFLGSPTKEQDHNTVSYLSGTRITREYCMIGCLRVLFVCYYEDSDDA